MCSCPCAAPFQPGPSLLTTLSLPGLIFPTSNMCSSFLPQECTHALPPLRPVNSCPPFWSQLKRWFLKDNSPMQAIPTRLSPGLLKTDLSICMTTHFCICCFLLPHDVTSMKSGTIPEFLHRLTECPTPSRFSTNLMNECVHLFIQFSKAWLHSFKELPWTMNQETIVDRVLYWRLTLAHLLFAVSNAAIFKWVNPALRS